MYAAVLEKIGSPLVIKQVPTPLPKENQLLIEVYFCGVCRTDLHIFEGELLSPKLPLILGHQVVGVVKEKGKAVSSFKVGDIVGVPWLAKTCGKCFFCLSSEENLCDNPLFTGYTVDGGFAEFCLGYEEYIIPLTSSYLTSKAAPLLCAGLIGYRALKLANGSKKIGFYGFGSSAHILTQIVSQRGGKVYAFTRPHDKEKMEFALSMGAEWAGSSDILPPTLLDSAIIFAPDGELVIHALKALRKGGKLIIAGIHMSDIPSFPYSLLWEERSIQSVANLQREDAKEFFSLTQQLDIETKVTLYSLSEAAQALNDLKSGKLQGSAVIEVKHHE